MKIPAVSLYLIWSLMSSSINQMVNTAPSSKLIKCYSCLNEQYPLQGNFATEYYNKRCNNTIDLCKSEHMSCGISIDKEASNNTLKISTNCIWKTDCENKQMQLNLNNIDFAKKIYAVDCCKGSLCNTRLNSAKVNPNLVNPEKDKYNKNCPSFIDNYQQLYLSDESNNIAKINDDGNLLISYNDIDADYVKRNAISSTWLAVFQDKIPYKEIMIASFKRNYEGKFVLTKSNKEIIKDNNIIDFKPNSLSLCNFKLRDLNIILNKVVTAKNIRLFGVILSDTGEVPAHARNFIKQLISRHNVTIHNDNYEQHNNTATQKTSLAKLITLMPIIMTGVTFN